MSWRLALVPALIATALAQPSRAAEIERAQALNGTLYAVIAPTFNGTTQSYVRLFNGATTTQTFSVSVVGSPSGRVMGTANIQVPSNASIQKDLNSIITAANAGSLTGGDTGYSLYLQNPDSTAGYQHVTFNSTNNFFENATVCAHTLNQVLADSSNAVVLNNVHTTQLASYPSTIYVHNYWNAPVTYRFNVRAASTGVSINTFTQTIGANSTLVMAESDIEKQINWQPNGEAHVNIFIVDTGGGKPYVDVMQAIVNSGLQNAQINMSTACAVNAPSTSSTGTFTGGGY